MKIITKKVFFLLVVFYFLINFQQVFAISETLISSAPERIAVLEARVDTLQVLNQNILNSVYWTLGILATIFLGLISVNLYFNISGNKREIEKIKEDFTTTAKNEILASEAKILEKISALNQKEFTSIKSDLLATTKNEILASEAKILEKINVADKTRVADSEIIKKETSSIRKTLDDMDTKIKEFEIDRFAQKGQQGQIMRMIDLLGKSIDGKKHDIMERLVGVRDYVKKTDIRAGISTNINKQLAKIEATSEYKTIVKEIQDSIRVFVD